MNIPSVMRFRRVLAECLFVMCVCMGFVVAPASGATTTPSAVVGGISLLDLSRAIAADTARPIDVRVTALHAIGDDPGVLDLARAIAPDRSQPLLLRKTALNLIGRHGQKQDLEVLRLCSRESPRLAQAGDPAARSLQDRIAGHIPPVLQPY